MSQSDILSALLRNQAELQQAVKALLKQRTPETPPTRAPSEVLTKLVAGDDVESYIELFERTATREGWPVADWAVILTPFLSGESQKACADLSSADSRDYAKLKTAILARHGHSLPARAQRFHNWTFQGSAPPRTQVADLVRLTKAWLTSPGEPPFVDRIVIDKCIRALPHDARKYAAQVSPSTVEDLIALLENHQTCIEMLRTPRAEAPKPSGGERSGRDKGRPSQGPNAPNPRRDTAPDRRRRSSPTQRCYICGKPDHISWTCPDRDRDVAMASATGSDKPAMYARKPEQKQKMLPVKIGGVDTQALLDSGSVITLVRPAPAGRITEDTIPVTCVHGDARHYPTTTVQIITPRGGATITAAVVPNLPVPMILGTDCVLFDKYWTPSGGLAHSKPRKRRPAGRSR